MTLHRLVLALRSFRGFLTAQPASTRRARSLLVVLETPGSSRLSSGNHRRSYRGTAAEATSTGTMR